MLCHPDIAKGSVIQVTHTPVEPNATFSLAMSKREYDIKELRISSSSNSCFKSNILII